MSDIQSTPYVYKTDFNVIDEVRQNAKELVTSRAIFDKIRQMGTTSLIDSGYVTDCIISIRKNHDLTFVDGKVQVGSTDRDNYFYIPDGFDDDGVAKFKHRILTQGTVIRENYDFKSSVVIDGDVSLVVDIDNSRIICVPNRTAVVREGVADGNFFQYIFAQTTEPVVIMTGDDDHGTIWWDLTTNYMKEYTAGGWVVRDLSIPIGIGSRVSGKTVAVKTDFVVGGYLQKATWVNTGVQFNFPEGRDAQQDNALICNPKTSGRDELGHDTYQPIMKTILQEETPITEVHTFTYDPDVLTNNTIRLIKLDGVCKASNTLSLYVTKNNVTTKKDVGSYYLADDDKTIVLNSYLTLLEGETISVECSYYDTLENAPLFVTNSWEILGPTDEIAFSTDLGHYIDANGNKVICCKYATMNSGYVVPKNIRESEDLAVVSYSPKTCFTLADGDDIETLIELIGNSTGETMNQVLASLEELTKDVDDMDTRHNRLINELRDELVAKMDAECVHKESPSGVEIITGNKEFTGSVTANITGVASMVNKVFSTYTTINNEKVADDVEIRPMGIPVAYKTENGTSVEDESYVYSNTDPIRVNTTVRIGKDFVKATEFRGTASKALWADLAEVYLPDKDYEVGTLVVFGGEAEITEAHGFANAVISEKPAYLMNSGAEGLPVALVGRVPVKCGGDIKKHDRLTCSPVCGEAIKANEGDKIIAIALEDKKEGSNLVECIVQLNLM